MSKNLWDDVGVDVSDANSSIEAMDMAGLSWEVQAQVPKYDFEDSIKESPTGQLVIRQDNGKVLGVVGDRYTPVQNQACFQFFDPLVNAEENLEYSRAGALDGGRRVFLVATIDEPIHMGNGDIIDKHILLVNSHDGSTSIGMNLTPIRLWCKNMLNVATSEKLSFSLNHTTNVGERLDKAKVLLKDAYDYYDSLEEYMRTFRETHLSGEQLQEIMIDIHGNGEDEFEELSTKAQNDIDTVLNLFHEGSGITEDIRNTCYAGFNAISEFADHYKTVRNPDRPAHEARFDSALFGSSKRMKQEGFDSIQKLVA